MGRRDRVGAKRIHPLTGDRDKGNSICLQDYRDLALCVPYYLMEVRSEAWGDDRMGM